MILGVKHGAYRCNTGEITGSNTTMQQLQLNKYTPFATGVMLFGAEKQKIDEIQNNDDDDGINDKAKART